MTYAWWEYLWWLVPLAPPAIVAALFWRVLRMRHERLYREWLARQPRHVRRQAERWRAH